VHTFNKSTKRHIGLSNWALVLFWTLYPPLNLLAQTSGPPETMVTTLAQQIDAIDIEAFAAELFETPITDSLWSGGHNASSLDSIVRDERHLTKTRLIAAEVLRQRDFKTFSLIPPSMRAAIYVSALRERTLPYDEPWGKLWEGNDLGVWGKVIVECQENAFPSLKVALLDTSLRNVYFGSEESTVMALRNYRVCDIAFFLVNAIENKNIPWVQNPESRSKLIQIWLSGHP
jgi:hypothetical protein